MTENYYKPALTVYGEAFANRIKNRVRLLILFSTLTVALAFGFSFYFGLISGTSAITRQIPELEPITGKLQSLLMVNTLGFIVIIIGSFYILAQLVTARMFSPVARVNKKIREISEKGIPENDGEIESGPFEELESSCARLVTSLRSRDEKEIGVLKKQLEMMRAGADIGQLGPGIEEMIRTREIRLAKSSESSITGRPRPDEKNDSLFLQPS